jgi:hypothetical protein
LSTHPRIPELRHSAGDFGLFQSSIAIFSGRNFKATATEFDVLGLIDHTHASAAKLLDDAVVRNGLANHRRESRLVNESRAVDPV